MNTLFLEFHITFSETDHILVHKASLNIQKKIHITLCTLFDHHRLNLDIIINNRKTVSLQIRETEHFTIEEKMGQDKTSKQNENFVDLNENEYRTYQNLWDAMNIILRGIALMPT